MELPCILVQARFPQQGLSLAASQPLSLRLDSHHEDTFILQLKGFTVSPARDQDEARISLELRLEPGTDLKLGEFAAAQQVPLSPAPPAGELSLPLSLAACHLPEKRLFIFSERATLQVSPVRRGTLLLTVQGEFRSRIIPCQETDLLLHLGRPQAAVLLAYLAGAARGVG